MHLKRRLIGLLAAFVLSATVIVPLTAGPAAAASCFASSCTGKDPINTGCVNDAQTIYTVNGVGAWGSGTLQLRYSPTCAAAWAKIYNDGSWNFDTISVSNTIGNYESQAVGNSSGAAYTNMVNDLGSIQSIACVGPSQCTGWY
jgi:hypothetical protein